MEYPVTESRRQPLAVHITQSWEKLAEFVGRTRVTRDYRPFYDAMKHYLELRFSDHGVKHVGLIEAAQSDPRLFTLLTSKVTIQGKDGGKLQKPLYRPHELSKLRLLEWAVELAGSPRRFEKGSGNKVPGVGHDVPRLPTTALEIEWGPNTAVLQNMAIVSFAAGKLTAFKWACTMNSVVGAAMYAYVQEHGLQAAFERLSAPTTHKTQQQLAMVAAQLRGYNAGRDLAVQEYLKALARDARSPSSPTEAMAQLVPSKPTGVGRGVATTALPARKRAPKAPSA